jgi:hypothetical protein
LEGIAINKVGDSPLQRDVVPSYRAILTNPSQVPSNLRSDVCSTTQLSGKCVGAVVEAMQASAMFPAQNTSRQQAVTPSSGAERVVTDRNRKGDSGRSRALPSVFVVDIGLESAVEAKVETGCWD